MATVCQCLDSDTACLVSAAGGGQEGSEWLGQILRGSPHGVRIEAMEAAVWLRLRPTGQKRLPAKAGKKTLGSVPLQAKFSQTKGVIAGYPSGAYRLR